MSKLDHRNGTRKGYDPENHGHIFEGPGQARCGGPGVCEECWVELHGLAPEDAAEWMGMHNWTPATLKSVNEKMVKQQTERLYRWATEVGLDFTTDENMTITTTLRYNSGTFSVEKLYHFNCAKCQKWWSVADADHNVPPANRRWYCPWCGHYQSVTEKS